MKNDLKEVEKYSIFILDPRPLELSAFNRRDDLGGVMRGEWLFLAANPTDETFGLSFKELLPAGVNGKGKQNARQ